MTAKQQSKTCAVVVLAAPLCFWLVQCNDGRVQECANDADCGGKTDHYCDVTDHQCRPRTCAPKSCQELAKQCGSWDDGCRGNVDCGSCAEPETCNASTGRCEDCTPDCGARQCGAVPNGCGESCGTCQGAEICNGTECILSTGIDEFGIKKLYESSPGGREWVSKWDNGVARTFDGPFGEDLSDPELLTFGTGTFHTDGKGVLQIGGAFPRMFVVDSEQIGRWRNVEVTVYGMRISDSNIDDSWNYAGIMAYARTNHLAINYGDASNPCDTRGIGGRFLYGGDIDFEKETRHDAPNGYAQAAAKNFWPRGMEKDSWIGYKYVVYDMPDGNVKLELWIDDTDGADGGTWTKIDDFVDTGSNFGIGNDSCENGIDPALRLTSSDSRPGSESGHPNSVVYFRTDNVDNDGLWLKKSSVREIEPILIDP